MIHIYIATLATSVAAAQALAQAKARAMPPPLPKTAAEIAKEKHAERISNFFMWAWIVIAGLPFVVLPALLIFTIVKFMLARQGIRWP